jgi:hypothetical protein
MKKAHIHNLGRFAHPAKTSRGKSKSPRKLAGVRRPSQALAKSPNGKEVLVATNDDPNALQNWPVERIEQAKLELAQEEARRKPAPDITQMSNQEFEAYKFAIMQQAEREARAAQAKQTEKPDDENS